MRAVYSKMWKKKYGRDIQATDDNIIRGMRFACWISKATDKNLRMCNILACPLSQRLHASPSVSGYTYISRLV